MVEWRGPFYTFFGLLLSKIVADGLKVKINKEVPSGSAIP